MSVNDYGALKDIQFLSSQIAAKERDIRYLNDCLASALKVADARYDALHKIAAPRSCGCRPCTGQCSSRDALLIEIEALQEIATSALAAPPAPPQRNGE
jgi:hypothetical protein